MISYVVTMIAGGLIVALSLTHTPAPRPESKELLTPPSQIKYFALGYNEIVADSLWIRVIQDFDTCGKEQAEPSAILKTDDIASADIRTRTGRCEMSWVYRMIDGITELAPKFRAPYSDGGVILSVAIDDIQGASKIYDKAIAAFPNDFPILYKAAYHFLYEIGDKPKAAHLLRAARKNGGPLWLDILAARLYSKTGRAQLGLQVLQDFIQSNPDKADDPHVQKRLAEIKRDLAAGDDPEPTTGAATAAAPDAGGTGAAQRPTALPKKKQ